MGMINQSEKTLVFCATQDHALAVRDLINQMKDSTRATSPSTTWATTPTTGSCTSAPCAARGWWCSTTWCCTTITSRTPLPQEPGCAVIAAVDQGEIAASRASALLAMTSKSGRDARTTE